MSAPDASPVRPATAIDGVAEAHLDDMVALDPVAATYLGIPGHDHRLPTYDPDWFDAVADLRRRTLEQLESAPAVDTTDRVTAAALRSELGVAVQLHEARADGSALSNIDSPVQFPRDVFDLMPTATVADWATVAARLQQVPAALAGYADSLRDAAQHGVVPARRQIGVALAACADNAGPAGFFARFAAGATADEPLPGSLQADLTRAAVEAGAAYETLGTFLSDELGPQTREKDAVGRELYALHSQAFLGSRVDLEETYAWGQDELARITEEMASTASRIRTGATVDEAIAHLDASPAHKLVGTAALQEWMQRTADESVEALADVHFDIPEPIRRLECRIAPTEQGGIYYTGPSEDLVTRPGRMWWSVPKGVTEFATWRELTTVYHEGVPGHHLQVAQTAYRSSLLNRWRRLASWISGHGEGWALYAERLMADLGYLDDPADHLGMLDGQSLRAARVVLDIGIHCELPAPASVGGGAWDYDKAWEFLGRHAHTAEGFRRFELDRYLGWPGQAPSYKIGERTWLQLRDDARAAAGASFDLKAFHRRALDVGSVGLDVLRAAVLGTI